MEAMACGLPVVATNWSGPAVYLDDAVGYPLRVDGMVDAGYAACFPCTVVNSRC